MSSRIRPKDQGSYLTGKFQEKNENFSIKTSKTADELASETQREYLKLLPRVKVKKGFKDFVTELRESGIKIALTTSNIWFILEKVFDEFPLEGLFDSMTTGEEVVNKKPEPDLFLKAADKLDIPPRECLVIEDSPSGVEAAREAGMKVVAIASDDKQAKILRGADFVVRDYNQLMKGSWAIV